jgi:hypothetical protein
MTHIQAALGGLGTLASTVFGSKLAVTVSQTVADATQQPLPSWAQLMMGPFGAFAGMALGLAWVVRRLDKAEAKADKREDERDADRKSLISVVEQNSVVMHDIKEVINKCKGHQQ